MGTGLSDATNATKDMWKYNGANDNWTQIADIPVALPRMGMVNFVVNDIAYIGTGYDFTLENNDLFKYNPITNSWNSVTIESNNLPGRHSGVSFSINNIGYIVTGNSSTGRLADLWYFRP